MHNLFFPDAAASQGTRTVAIAVGVVIPLVLVAIILIILVPIIIRARKYWKHRDDLAKNDNNNSRAPN